MSKHRTHHWSASVVLSAMERLRHGLLTVELPSGTRNFGNGRGHEATLRVLDDRFFMAALTGGEVGIGDAYMDGWWSTPDLVALVRLMLANRQVLDGLPQWLSWAPALAERVAHWYRNNTRAGSRRNIHRHYDLGNKFFELFLDPSLMYSCALYESPGDSLESAQLNKLRVICERLDLRPHDHVLEIGTGWGGFALFASTHYGCRVTTTTISAEQHAEAAARFAEAGDAGRRIDLRFEDYRDLSGRFDKIVSIEMFEAVGLKHYDDFFGACDRLLSDDGAMLLQTITVDDWRFADYLGSPSWIAKRIFPGSELASVAGILASQARVSTFSLHHAMQIGTHYARTLHQWRERFHARIDDVRAQGFDERFIRMWDLYLAFCEAAFMERHIGDAQLVFTKPSCRIGAFNGRRHRDRRPDHVPATRSSTDVRALRQVDRHVGVSRLSE